MDYGMPVFLVLHVSRSLLKLMSIELVMLFNHLILCHPLLLPSIFPSIRAFSNELALRIRWPKYWRFSFSNNPSNKYSGLIFFKNDWFDLFPVQGTLKSLLQHYILKAQILWRSAFSMVLFLFSSPVACWTSSNLGGSSSGVISFLPFHTVHGVLEARILE